MTNSIIHEIEKKKKEYIDTHTHTHTHTHTYIYIYTYKVYYKTKMKKFCYMLGKVNIKSKKMRLFVSFFLG